MTVSRSFTIDTIITYISQALVVILGVVLVKIMSSVLSTDEFGIYLLSRRFILFGVPLITLNMGMGLAWITGNNRQGATRLFHRTIFLEILLFFMLFLLISTNLQYFSHLLFNDKKYSGMMYPILLFLFASGFQVLFIGYWRGNQQYRFMNITNIAYRFSSLLVLVILVIYGAGSLLSFYFYSSGVIIIAANLILYFIGRHHDPETDHSQERNFAELIQYSISRIPSGLFYGLLFYVPMYIAMKIFSLHLATLIGIIITVITTISLAGSPLNLLLLPTFSNFRLRKKQYIINKIEIVLTFIFQIVFFAGPFLFFFSDELIQIWFGKQYSQASLYLRIVSPAVGPFIGYVMVRGINDGLSKYPYSNINTMISLITTLTLSFVLNSIIHNPLSLVIAFTIGLFTLFFSTMYSMEKIIGLSLLKFHNIKSILYVILTYAIFYIYSRIIHIFPLDYSYIIKLIVFSIIVLFLLKRSGIVRTIWSDLIHGN